VDTCRHKYRDKILAACKNANVRLILLTHGHIDHVENAAFLSKALGVPIAMHRLDWALIVDNNSEPMKAHTLPGKLILSFIRRSFDRDKNEPFEPVFLQDGDTLSDFEVDADIIGLPGHTRGSIGVVYGDDIIVGDALMNIFYPTLSMLYGNLDEMRESGGKIGKLSAKTVHFGHGKSVTNRIWLK
jgi:glyoxylase-like metal-dependent hydrolase (beta-lactamase superfamily II)